MAYEFFTKTQEPYEFLLQRREWLAKRDRILTRDGHKCRHCGRPGRDVQLHVHHMHYICGLDPWEYKDSELITLCEECHSNLHMEEDVPVYRLRGSDLVMVERTPCRRCGGAGWFPEYKHVQNGICFRCHGARYEEEIEAVEEYAMEHDINLTDMDYGYRPFPKDFEGKKFVNARVRAGSRPNVLLAYITDEIGRNYCFCLDFSVKAKPGNSLVMSSLKYRKAIKANGDSYIIVKGNVA